MPKYVVSFQFPYAICDAAGLSWELMDLKILQSCRLRVTACFRKHEEAQFLLVYKTPFAIPDPMKQRLDQSLLSWSNPTLMRQALPQLIPTSAMSNSADDIFEFYIDIGHATLLLYLVVTVSYCFRKNQSVLASEFGDILPKFGRSPRPEADIELTKSRIFTI